MALRNSKKRFPVRLPLPPGNPKKRVAQGILFALLLLAAASHLKSGFLEQLAMTMGPQTANFSRSLTRADALAALARREHLANGNLAGAARLYRRGLAHFVLHVPSWLGIIELYNDRGEKERAAEALRFVESFAADTGDTAWAKALLAHELDLEDILADNLVWLAANHHRKLPEIFTLAELRWPEPERIMQHFGPALHADLLEYYIKRRDPAGAETVWRVIEQAGGTSRETALDYVNFLLQQENIVQAARIWQRHYLQEDSLLFNPGLREPFLGSGFAWRISRADSVTWQPLAGNHGLEIRFDGTENVNFHLGQIVPLPPGEYVFRGLTAARDLTTDQLPYWSVSGYKCEGLNVKGPMLPPSADPHEFTLPFTVPDSCRAVLISLRRNTSYFFDNKIAGAVQVEDLTLEPQILTAVENPLPGETPAAFEGMPGNSTGITIESIIVQ